MRSLKALVIVAIPLVLAACGSSTDAETQTMQSELESTTVTTTKLVTTTATTTETATSTETATVTETVELTAQAEPVAQLDTVPQGLASIPDPAPAPAAVPAPSNTYYANCAAVRAAGAAPIYRGTPGYSAKLDRDGDGVGCE